MLGVTVGEPSLGTIESISPHLILLKPQIPSISQFKACLLSHNSSTRADMLFLNPLLTLLMMDGNYRVTLWSILLEYELRNSLSSGLVSNLLLYP